MKKSFRREFRQNYPDAVLTVKVHSDEDSEPIRVYALASDSDATFGGVTNVISHDAMLHGTDSDAWYSPDASDASRVGSFSCRFIRAFSEADIYYFRYKEGGLLMKTIEGKPAHKDGHPVLFAYLGEPLTVIDSPSITVTIGPTEHDWMKGNELKTGGWQISVPEKNTLFSR